MTILELTIQRKAGEGWPVVTMEQTAGVSLPVRKEGMLKVEEEELLRQPTPREYGTVLGKALFQEDIRDAFVKALRDSGDCLRVLLFVEAPELRTWRWERLCAPLDGSWDFLALNQRTPFSLYLPSLTDRLFPPIGRMDLRALALVASPAGLDQYGLDPFDVESAVSGVKTALGEIPCDVLADVVGSVEPPTLDALCGRLTQEPYTLLHVICHGQVDSKSRDTNLFMGSEDIKESVSRVSGTLLIDRLRKLGVTHGLPRFAFLATCESASPKAEGALGGLAQRLVRELGMPAVVAMTERVSVATAQALAEGFYRRLREHGEVDRALAEATAALAGRYDITVPALFSRLGGRPLFSDTLDRPLTPKEEAFGLSRLGDLVQERAPVLCPEFEKHAATLRGALGVDPMALSAPAQEERKHALEEVNKLCGEVLDLSFKALALGQEPPAYDSRCPFRGLYPFAFDDREFFFGRERLVESLQRRLTEHNFLAVLGPSGCGKSSVVMAGLIPALQSREPGLQMTYMTPGSDPLGQLEGALAQEHGSPLVLVVDQFEELFTLCTDENKRWAFLDRLLPLIRDRRVMITMRADFWGDCARYTALKEAMLAHQELIAPMDAAELRRAIEMQVQKVGLRFDADLSNSILDDVQGEPGAMPLLQHALLQLWKRRHGRWLRADEYRAIGGVQQAIARTADEIYEHSPKEDQERIRNIFIRLTRLGDETGSEQEQRDTRRRCAMWELVSEGDSLEAVRKLVHHLGSSDARLVVVRVSGLNKGPEEAEVEVAHEALIRYWPRLRNWLGQDRASLRLRETIRQAALEWQDEEREEGLLVHRGSRLEDVELLSRQPRYPLNDLERDYVDACVTLREREKAEKEEHQRRELEQAHALAEERRARLIETQQLQSLTVAQAIAAQANYELYQKPQRSLLLAVESIRIALDADEGWLPAALQALRNALSATGGIPLGGHEKAVSSVAFNHSGRLLASGGHDRTVRLLDLSNPDVEPTLLLGHEHVVSCVAFSPNNRFLASGSGDRTIRLWKLGDLKADPVILAGHDGPVFSIAFSQDSWLLASGGRDQTVCLWDTTDFKAKPVILRGQRDSVTSVAFSSDGRMLVSGCEDQNIRVWRMADLKAKPAIMRGHENIVTSVAFSPNGRMIASGSEDETVRIWTTADLKAKSVILRGHGGVVKSVAFRPNSQLLASGGRDQTVRLWDTADLRSEPVVLLGHEGSVNNISFSPSGTSLASASEDHTIRLWDMAQPKSDPIILPGHEDFVRSVAISPNSQLLASGSGDRTVRLWDMANPKSEPVILRGHDETVRSLAFSPNNQLLASGGRDQKVLIWDTKNRLADPIILRGHKGPVSSVIFSPDGSLLASGNWDRMVYLWDTSNLKADPVILMGHEDSVYSIAFSPRGLLIATGGRDETIRVWHTKNPKNDPITLSGHGGPIYSVAFSPDGRLLASGCEDKMIRVWDTTDLKVDPGILSGHMGPIFCIGFSPDSRLLASGGRDQTVRLWDTLRLSNDPVILSGHKDSVSSVVFSPDGMFLASGGHDRTVRLWNISMDKIVKIACLVAGRNLTNEEWQQYFGDVPYHCTCSESPVEKG